MLAVIKRRNTESMRWIFEMPLDSWILERYEEDGVTVQCYTTLKSHEFTEERTSEILAHEGLIFQNEEDFSAWIEEFGGLYAAFE
jgi:hypothetical protein